MKILLSAFACDPKTGSEPYVGWNWAKMLRDDMEVHVLTRSYSRHLIEAVEKDERLHFHYFDLPFMEGKDHHWRFIKPYYIFWQLMVLPFAWRLAREHRFDVIQHLTYNNIDIPGFLWLCPAPNFVWGPVGGGQTAPPSLKAVYGKSWWKEQLRGVLKKAARYNPVVRGAVKRARLVLFANAETAERLKGLPNQSHVMLETAINDFPGGAAVAERQRDQPVRVLWLSHMFPRKGVGLAIDSFDRAWQASKIDMELIVIGDGAAMEDAREHAARAVSKDRVKLLGKAPYEEVQNYMSSADIFLFTSVQDTSGNVILEAMRAALPVIALDHQGAKVLLSAGGGRLVPIGSYEETCENLAIQINELAANEGERTTLGHEAREVVLKRYSWEAKKRDILRLYSAFPRNISHD